MSENATAIQWNSTLGSSISMAVSFLFVIISVLLCLIIIIIICITSSLHSPSNVLVSNTCFCTLLYSIISTIDTYLFYIEYELSDWSCRVEGYLNYVFLKLVIYSYIIQAISRLFWTLLYRHRYLLTYKSHIYLIISHICLSFVFPLSTLISQDIVYRPMKNCLVSIKYKSHVLYLLIIGYIIPFLGVVILYGIIYHHIVRSPSTFRRSSHGTKRDAALTRNIIILLSMFMFGGVPTVIYIIVSSKTDSVPNILFILAITTPSIAVAIEKIVTIRLNKDIRKALKQRWIRLFPTWLSSSTRVQPLPYTNNTNRRTISGTCHATNVPHPCI